MNNKRKQKRRLKKNVIKTSIALATTGMLTLGGYTFSQHYESKLEEKIMMIEELQKANQEHQENISRASANIENNEIIINSLTEENNTLKREKESLTQEKTQLNQEKEKINQEKEQLNQKNKELQEKVNKLEKELNSRTFSLEASNYTATCKPVTVNGTTYGGCSGVTATGVNVKNTVYYNGRRIVATDPKVIPMKSILRLYYNDGTTEEVIAMDKGGYIKGNKIDILVKDEKTAREFGRQTVKAVVLQWG